MDKKDPIYRLGEVVWVFGTLGLAALAVWYGGLPAAGYVDELLFGPKPREQGFLLGFIWLLIVPNVAAAPFFLLLWLSSKAFGRDKEDERND